MTVSRVYEFAKAHNMSSKAVLELAKKNGIDEVTLEFLVQTLRELQN